MTAKCTFCNKDVAEYYVWYEEEEDVISCPACVVSMGIEQEHLENADEHVGGHEPTWSEIDEQGETDDDDDEGNERCRQCDRLVTTGNNLELPHPDHLGFCPDCSMENIFEY